MSAPINPSPFDPTSGNPPRRRRWIPLSVRMFAAMLLLLGVSSVLWISVLRYHQRAAIGEIERVHGAFSTEPRGPEWLRDLVGDDAMKVFDEFDWVDLSGRHGVTDATLAELSWLTGLNEINLGHTQVTDAGLGRLRRLTKLKRLYLSTVQVTDDGLAHVHGMTELQTLSVANTSVGDKGIAHLTNLKNLERLNLSDTQVTDAGVAHLANLTHLRQICLTGTHVTDDGIAELRRALPKIEILKSW